MALPTSGKISVADILREMGRQRSRKSLDGLAREWYQKTGKIKFNKATHRLSDWHGEKWGSGSTNTKFQVSHTSVALRADGDSAVINVSSNTTWEVNVPSPFIASVGPQSGSGDGKIYIYPGSPSPQEAPYGGIQVISANGDIIVVTVAIVSYDDNGGTGSSGSPG